jgi:hypothetical protein
MSAPGPDMTPEKRTAFDWPRNFPAPVHYRWPEYVTTPRGEEWWIPTPPDAEAPA